MLMYGISKSVIDIGQDYGNGYGQSYGEMWLRFGYVLFVRIRIIDMPTM